MFHGTDERIPLSALEASVRIMDRFLTAPQADPEIF
jgi:acetylornithine deacetylase/succinyl-diaminopimelate desuccinylase-like protein